VDIEVSPEVENFVDHTIRDELSRFPINDLVGVSCLSDGADQFFARAVVNLGGKLEIIIVLNRDNGMYVWEPYATVALGG
jgi:hypothetical protein